MYLASVLRVNANLDKALDLSEEGIAEVELTDDTLTLGDCDLDFSLGGDDLKAVLGKLVDDHSIEAVLGSLSAICSSRAVHWQGMAGKIDATLVNG